MSTEGTVTMSLGDYEAIMVESDAMKRRLEQRGGDSPDPVQEAIYHQLRLLTIHATTMEARLIPDLLAGLETLHRLFGGPKPAPYGTVDWPFGFPVPGAPKPLKAPRCTCGYCRAIEEAMNGSPFKRASTPR